MAVRVGARQPWIVSYLRVRRRAVPMADAILVLNAGSSSLKFSLFALGGRGARAGAARAARGPSTTHALRRARSVRPCRSRRARGIDALGHDGAMTFLLDYLARRADGPPAARGRTPRRARRQRVRAAGAGRCGDHAAPEKLVPLAPLHQPHNLAPIRALLERAPALPQVACFDTAFHRTHAGARQGCRAAAIDHERGVQPLRLSRPVVRVHRERAAGACDAPARSGRTIVVATWATAPRCARCRRRAASRRRWASPRSTDS